MTTEPLVSVVMSVYNGAGSLAATMDSVLTQQGVSFEFIIIDDGSTDGSGVILDDYARRDGRVRVIHQANTGLTRALIRGCAEARGRYIARQDAGGDRSLPGRLARQCAFLESKPEVVMTSCGTRFVGPRGELLYETIQHGDELQQGLSKLQADQIRGPSHHGSVLFRRADNVAVGGFRAEFQVAQDLDLWVRLMEQGQCMAIPDILYEAVWTHGSISHLRRRHQVQATEAIVACRARRRLGLSEQPILDQLRSELEQSRRPKAFFSGLERARFDYFVGSTLAGRDSGAARRYFSSAVAAWPLHIKAWLKLLRCWMMQTPKPFP